MSNLRTSQLEQERAEYRASITEALDEDRRPAHRLLEETLRKFKDDARYSGDLRYLKIWCSYAKMVEKPSVVYAYLVKREIGCVYALLWEEYAVALEKEGEADKAFRAGISRSARPLERLKRRYRDFQSRPPSSKCQLPPFKPSGVAEVDALRRNPLKNSTHKLVRQPRSHSLPKVPPRPVSQGAPAASPSNSAHARYATMLAPPAPGKRPEKLRLISHYYSRLQASNTPQQRRKSVSMVAAGEPTVTINTKEALADVFGMYNSPDKTVKRSMPGSKYAPVRKVEPLGGRSRSTGDTQSRTCTSPSENENAKPQAFKPYVDENAPGKKLGRATEKPAPVFAPDSKPSPPHPPKPTFLKPPREESEKKPVFSKPFTPVSRKEPRATVEYETYTRKYTRGTAGCRYANPAHQAFVPFVDSKTPFKVFSRPPGHQGENGGSGGLGKVGVFTPKPPSGANLMPANALQASTSARKANALQPRVIPPTIEETFTDESSLGDGAGYGYGEHEPEMDGHAFSSSSSHTNLSEVDEEEGAQQAFVPEHEQQDSYRDDGDFDREETDYNEPLVDARGIQHRPTAFLRDGDWRERQGRESGKYAVEVAEKLAREVQEDDDIEGDYEEYVDGIQGSHDPPEQVVSQNNLDAIEDRTGTLSLCDSLAVISAFRPPNPCNPFDPAIVSTLLSLLPVDGDFYDLRVKDGGMLDGLQRFAAKQARGSKGASTEDGERADSVPFSLREIFRINAEDDEKRTLISMWTKRMKPQCCSQSGQAATLPARSSRPSAVCLPRRIHLLLELCQHGTLLDIVNRAGRRRLATGACLDELLVFFYMIELLRFVEGMHGAGFIHGDLKIDNCLLRIEELPGGASSLSSMYQPSGEGGWKYRGIKVIDFGRAIDTSLFPAGHNQLFIADWPTDERDCFEIRQNQPWTISRHRL
ncbi:hypothetical protein EDC04DRAFT_3034243 [Pisolithus marmoratus]|nr:hypothetical protein EDC04DRAFT_3034243 [Pisolithus marmoratus]